MRKAKIPIVPRMQFDRLTVIGPAKPDKWGNSRFECRCDCGAITQPRANDLQRGKAKSCGCRGLFQITPGMRIGKLTVIGRTESSSSGKIQYTCLCDCGNITQPTASNLRNGATKSCGCLHRERVTRHGDAKNNNVSSLYRC
jgi:hypothetical protein